MTMSAAMVRAAQRSILKAAVCRAIFCHATQAILDVRRAVYFEIRTKGGVEASAVVTAAAWDGEYGETVRRQCGEVDIEITEVIDGRVVYARQRPTRALPPFGLRQSVDLLD